MGSNHSHGPVGPASSSAVRWATAVLVALGLVTAVAMVFLWPGERPAPGGRATPPPAQVNGDVLRIDRTSCPGDSVGEAGPGCGVTVRLTSGPDTGHDITTDFPSGPGAPAVTVGDAVVLEHQADAGNGKPYQITDHQRGAQLWILAAAFVAAVVAFGRWSGARALAGLAVTFAALLFFVIPAILTGESPLLVAIVGSSAIVLTVMYLTNGVHLQTSIAVIGTLAALTLTGLLGWLFTELMHLTGIADEESSLISVTYAGVDMQGLLLAGVIIGALGVLDDVTVTQASTVAELATANPTYSTRHLYLAATRVGRAHIASVVNTIILAYAGASLPLFLLLLAGNTPVGQLLTNELLAQEILRSAVGTIGLIAAVPVTTALAALTARHSPRGKHAG